jgi:hypothetical protein
VTLTTTAQGMTPSQPVLHTDGQEGRNVAEGINRIRPRWLVIWGTCTRRFCAYPLFDMRPHMIIQAGYPDALIARMDEAERRYRVQPARQPTGEQP